MIYLGFAVLGLGAGALYAAMASGIVLVYRGSGVINLAHGAMAMYVAYAYVGLRQGRLAIWPLPNPLKILEWLLDQVGISVDMPNIPTFIDFHHDIPTA